MKIEKKYTGKWVAIKNNKVIASEVTLNRLNQLIQNRKDKSSLHFSLIPNGLISG